MTGKSKDLVQGVYGTQADDSMNVEETDTLENLLEKLKQKESQAQQKNTNNLSSF